MWKLSKRTTFIDALKMLPTIAPGFGTPLALDLIQRYEWNRRSFLRDADEEETGTVAVNNTSGSHLTAYCVLKALKGDTISALPQRVSLRCVYPRGNIVSFIQTPLQILPISFVNIRAVIKKLRFWIVLQNRVAKKQKNALSLKLCCSALETRCRNKNVLIRERN